MVQEAVAVLLRLALSIAIVRSLGEQSHEQFVEHRFHGQDDPKSAVEARMHIRREENQIRTRVEVHLLGLQTERDFYCTEMSYAGGPVRNMSDLKKAILVAFACRRATCARGSNFLQVLGRRSRILFDTVSGRSDEPDMSTAIWLVDLGRTDVDWVHGPTIDQLREYRGR